jgi:enoyl-CoA hydratase/carnithine racemase
MPERIVELNDACRTMSARDDVHIVVVTGAGRGFCSGADLEADIGDDYQPKPASGSMLDSGPGMWTLTAMRQPVIAMVNGAAVGYGAEMALQADLRIAGTSAKFRFPFSLLGTVSDTGAATWLLPRLVGWSRAAELLYSGRMIEADEALAIGLVNQVVPDDRLRETVTALAADLALRSAHALRLMKRMIFGGLDERKAEHVLGQYFAFSARDESADRDAYWRNARGAGSRA